MKKRNFLILPLFLTLIFLISACSFGKNQANRQVGNQNSGSANSVGRGEPRMPDFGQPDRLPDLRGLVKSVTGNEVVILKVDLRGGRNDQASSTRPEAENGQAPQGQAPAASLNGPGGQNQRFDMMGGSRPGEEDASARADMLARLKEMSTGEETVTIPVGIKMLKPQVDTATKQRTMVEATLNDITADKTITIWLNASVTDKKVAEFVLIN